MNQLKLKRLVMSVSQARLAKLSGVSRFKISQHECDYKELTGEEIDQIEAAFDKISGKAVNE